jgi:hypothetical protein
MEQKMEDAPLRGEVKADEQALERRPYHSPVLLLRGTLAELTQSTAGTRNGDGGQNMMVV